MAKDSRPKIYGLIGYPVKHSLSPAMHNAAFKSLGINAEYRLFEVKPEGLGDFFKSLAEKNIYGLNVTVPYKERVLDFVSLGSESRYLKQVGAVNTIVREGNKLKGFNTDIHGFEWHLKEKNFFNPAGKRAALLGAGGAARAVSYVLAKSGASQIIVFDIDKQKTENVIKMIKGLFPDFRISGVDSVGQLDIKNKDLLVNATPVGLRDTDPCLVNEAMLHKDLFVYDLIYNPPETKLLTLAKKAGAAVSNGLGMLQYQGALSFQHFNAGQTPLNTVFKTMGQALRQEIDKIAHP
jgi:shikimate dehydrogenase